LAVGGGTAGERGSANVRGPSQTPPAKKRLGLQLKKLHLPRRNRHDSQGQNVTALTSTKQKASYAIGMNWGTGLHRQGIDVDSAALIQGMKDALSGGKNPVDGRRSARRIDAAPKRDASQTAGQSGNR